MVIIKKNGVLISSDIESFMDYVEKRKKGIIPKPKRPLQQFQHETEIEEKLEQILPEPLPPEFKEKTIKELKVEAIEETPNGKRLTQYRMQNPIKTSYIFKRNPNIIQLANIGKNKIYYDVDKDAYYEYVISNDRKRLLQKNRLDKHDIMKLLAFCLVEIYGENIPKKVWISKKLRNEIEQIAKKINPNAEIHIPKYFYVNKEVRRLANEIARKMKGETPFVYSVGKPLTTQMG